MRRINHSSRFIEMFGNPLSPDQKYPLKRLGDCVEINPRRGALSLNDSDLVSFAPMPSVSEEGHLQDLSDVEFGKVKKGFTYFKNGDVLFAKITPCMENGKGAIAEGLTNDTGMGSTEFHILRPIEGRSSAFWALALTRLPVFREKAAKNMTGTGGQKRVPSSFLVDFPIGLPPIYEQNRFAEIYKQADKSKFSDFKSRFIEMFGNPVTNTKSWPTKALSEVAPESPSTNKATGLVWVLNLDMVESQSGRVIEKVYDNVENLNSVAPFDDGNVLFSKLRPYLNKVVIPNGKGYATTELVPLRPKTTFVRKEFLACLLRSNDFVNYADAIATGTKMPRMPMTALRDFRCIIPPVDLQDEFIKVSQQADKSKYLN